MGLSTEWTATVPGAERIWTGEASDAGVVYVRADGALQAVDAATGRIEWTAEADEPFSCGGGTAFLSAGATLWACDRDTGETKWEYVALDPIDDVRRTESGRSYVRSSDRDDGTGHVAALSADGTERWTYSTGLGPDTDLWIADEDPFVVDGDGTVRRFDPDAGTPVWSYDADRVFETVRHDDAVSFHGSDRIVALDPWTGEEIWSRRFVHYCSTFEVDDRSLYVGTEHALSREEHPLVSLDADTGRERWAVEARGSDTKYIDLGADTAFVAHREGPVAAFSKRTGKRRWRSTLDGNVLAIHAGHGILFARLERGTEYGFDARSGSRLWSADWGPSGGTSPRIESVGDYVVETHLKRILAFDPDDGSLVLDRSADHVESHGDALFVVDGDEVHAYALADDAEPFAETRGDTAVFPDDDPGTDTRVFDGEDGNARFCPGCGSPIDEDLAASFCPKCGREL